MNVKVGDRIVAPVREMAECSIVVVVIDFREREIIVTEFFWDYIYVCVVYKQQKTEHITKKKTQLSWCRWKRKVRCSTVEDDKVRGT